MLKNTIKLLNGTGFKQVIESTCPRNSHIFYYFNQIIYLTLFKSNNPHSNGLQAINHCSVTLALIKEKPLHIINIQIFKQIHLIYFINFIYKNYSSIAI